MNAKLITTIIDVVAVLFILIGFVFGIIRGLKGSVNRLLLILISCVAALFLTKLLSGTFLNINVPFLKDSAGASTSAEGYIASILSEYKLTDTITLAGFTLTVSFAVTMVRLVANLVVFILCFEILRFLTYIIYLIFFRTKKQKFEDGSYAVPKKKRWWGSLVGAFQGLFIFLFMFVPISGLSSVCAELNSTTSAAELTSNSGVIETFVPEEYQQYLNVYENSIFNKAVGWTKIDELLFNTLTSGKSGDVDVSFRNEVVSINEVVKSLNKYGLIDAYKNKTLKDKFNSLTDEQIDELSKEIFTKTTNSNLVKVVLTDSSNVLSQYLEVDSKLKVSDIDWKIESELIGGAASDIVCSVRPIISNVIDGQKAVTTEVLKDDSINYALLGRGVNKLSSLSLVKTAFNPLVKKVLAMDSVKQFGVEYGIDFTTITIENINFEKTFESIGGLIKVAIKIKDNASFENIADANISELLNSVKETSPEIAEKLNEVVIKTIEDQFEVDVPDDFNIFDNEELLETTTSTINAVNKVEENGNINAEQANEILSNFENLAEDSSTQAILDVVSKACGIESENAPTVSQAKDTASKFNEFVSASDEDAVALSADLVSDLNANIAFVKVLKFKNNKYLISQAKYNNLQEEALLYDATNLTDNAAEILSLFTVAE